MPHFATKLEPQPHEEAAFGLAAMTNAERIRSDSKSTVEMCGWREEEQGCVNMQVSEAHGEAAE